VGLELNVLASAAGRTVSRAASITGTSTGWKLRRASNNARYVQNILDQLRQRLRIGGRLFQREQRW